MEFVDRWKSLQEEYDLLLEVEIESKSTSPENAVDNWIRQGVIRQAYQKQKDEPKLFMDVGISTLSEQDFAGFAYKYLAIGDKRYYFDKVEQGKTVASTKEMTYGQVKVGFDTVLKIKPFSPWELAVIGENAMFIGASEKSLVQSAFPADKIFDSHDTNEGTLVTLLGGNGSIAYEILFAKEFDGLPSSINMYPYHDNLDVKNPGRNTRYFHRSKIEWRNSNSKWWVARTTVDSIDGIKPNVIKVRMDSKWTWSETVDSSLFDPPVAYSTKK